MACAGDIDEMDRCLERAQSMADQLRQPGLNWALSYEFAARALIAGDLEQAELLVTSAFNLGTSVGEPDAAIYFNGGVL